jgi:hypothetical protein
MTVQSNPVHPVSPNSGAAPRAHLGVSESCDELAIIRSTHSDRNRDDSQRIHIAYLGNSR